MNELTIPRHFAVPWAIAFLGLLTILFLRTRIFKDNKTKRFWIPLVIFFTVYLVIVGQAIYDDLYCQWDVNKYDLNMDGIFTGSEITKEQEEAMQRLTNDTGRNFSIITGFGFATIISTLTYFAGRIYSRLRGQ